MQIVYNILFIENENDWITSIEESLKDYLDDKGFSLNLKKSNVYPTDITDFNIFDIIVVDFHLDNSETGDKVIERIRNNNDVFTEILFYSSEGEEEIRKRIVALGGLDGVYCSDRNNGELLKNLKKLIYTTIRKSQDLNNLRGLVMAETSELDSLIKDLTIKLVENNKVSDIKVQERKTKLSEDYTNNINELEAIASFQDLVDSRHFSATFGWRTLCSFSDCTQNSLEKKEITPYKNDVIELRNLLAHSPEVDSTPYEMKIKKSDGGFEIFTEPRFETIRKSIRQYKERLIGFMRDVE